MTTVTSATHEFTLDTTESLTAFAEACVIQVQLQTVPVDRVKLVFEFFIERLIGKITKINTPQYSSRNPYYTTMPTSSTYHFQELVTLGNPLNFKESIEKISDFVRGASSYTALCKASAYDFKHKAISL